MSTQGSDLNQRLREQEKRPGIGPLEDQFEGMVTGISLVESELELMRLRVDHAVDVLQSQRSIVELMERTMREMRKLAKKVGVDLDAIPAPEHLKKK